MAVVPARTSVTHTSLAVAYTKSDAPTGVPAMDTVSYHRSGVPLADETGAPDGVPA